jgi:hypothetical protein
VNKLRFLHIPKTAGSTFDEGLFVAYLRAYLLRRKFVFSGNFANDLQRYERLSPGHREKIALFLGHAPRVTGIAAVDGLPTITLFRNPLERVKSFCQHVSEGKSPVINPVAAGRAMDLDAFLASGRLQLDNLQRNDLCGFGITEDFNRSMLLFKHTLGWKTFPLYRSRNVKNTKQLLTFEPCHIEKITELNQIDIKLYDRACILFRDRLERLVPDIERELAEYEKQLARPHPIFTAMDAARSIRRKL